MSIIKIPLHYEGSQGEKVIYTLFDSGATFSCISEDAILGVNTFQKWRIKLDFENDTVIIDTKVAKAMLK